MYKKLLEFFIVNQTKLSHSAYSLASVHFERVSYVKRFWHTHNPYLSVESFFARFPINIYSQSCVWKYESRGGENNSSKQNPGEIRKQLTIANVKVA